ncbi:MAG: GFA family protein [Alphaproteobacteria bacterium]|nr:GFA family protein [Alphaproteobacteria bacterium]
MSQTITGGCRCGAIRYETEAEPVMTLNCYCKDCQKASGTAGSAAFVVPREAVKVDGEPKFHAVVADSGQEVHRGFCPECGSPLFGKPDMAPALMAVCAGSLDDPGWFKPGVSVYTCRAHDWSRVPNDIPSFEKLPDQIPEV